MAIQRSKITPVFLALLLPLLLFACSSPTSKKTDTTDSGGFDEAHHGDASLSNTVDAHASPARFLALGDSYTIGQSVAESERWPVQLVAQLRSAGVAIDEPLIIARTGWTTGDLNRAIDTQMPAGPYALVSLLIGVNNQFRGHTVDSYRPEFVGLLNRAIALAGDEPGRVVVVSIPDWGVTPFASSRDQEQIATEIDAFNAVNREEAESAGVFYVDVTPISREAATDVALLASDGLHPSGEMYRRWVELVLPVVRSVLTGRD